MVMYGRVPVSLRYMVMYGRVPVPLSGPAVQLVVDEAWEREAGYGQGERRHHITPLK